MLYVYIQAAVLQCTTVEVAIRWTSKDAQTGKKCLLRKHQRDKRPSSHSSECVPCFCRSSRWNKTVCNHHRRKRVAGKGGELPKACLRKSLCVEPSINANPLTPQEGESNFGSIQAHRNYLHQIRMRTPVDNIQWNIIQSFLALWRSSGEGILFFGTELRTSVLGFFWGGQVSKTLYENCIHCTSWRPQIISSW